MTSRYHITVPFFIPMLGCPHRCVYCDQHITSGASSRPGKETILEKCEEFLATADPAKTLREIAFFGGTFTGLPRDYQLELLEAAAGIRRRGMINGVRVSTRPDFISRENVTFLVENGVTAVELGAQSFSDAVLSAAGRGHIAKDTVTASRLIKEFGLELVIQLMPGLPGDSDILSLESARIAASLQPDAVRIYPTVVVLGTPLETMFRTGKYAPLSLEGAVSLCAIIYRFFSERRIRVIRTGIHPVRSDERDNIVAGPYHPSLGFLVKSRVKRNLMEEKIAETLAVIENPPSSCTILLPEKEKEEYIGPGRENLLFIKNRFGFTHVGSRTADIAEIGVAW